MTELWDTTIRLLSQEPLSGRVSSSRLHALAGALDRAGFGCLEVTGGGCFDALVEAGVESPWERIRSLAARCRTPLGMALRGRFLVGTRPVSPDLVRRFIASAAESGIGVYRIHDPLNDVQNLRVAADAVHQAGKELAIGLVHNPPLEGGTDELVERARAAAELAPSRLIVNDPAGSLDAAHARELVERVREASGLPVGLYCQGAAGRALAAALEAARGGATPIGCTIYPIAITLYRPSAEALSQSLAGIGRETGLDLETLWEACALVDAELGDVPVPPLSPRDAVRAAQHRLPAGLVAALDDRLRVYNLSDRLDEVLAELQRVRQEVGWPPLVAPMANVVGSQALLHVLSARRWQTFVDEVRLLVEGAYGRPPHEPDPVVRRALELLEPLEAPELESLDFDQVREQARGLATSEEELLLLTLFGDAAQPLLATIRARARGAETLEAGGVEETRAERIRELIDLVVESGIGEVTIEEGEMRVTVRRGSGGADAEPAAGPPWPAELAEPALEAPRANGLARVESPMVGTFYRAPQPGAAPFVEIGDTVAQGQTLCILEAMKLMNEVKAELEAVVRAIHVENAEPVEYGQLLFELEPVAGRPPDGI